MTGFLVPKFGLVDHTPAVCGEPDANPPPKGRRPPAGPCKACGGKIDVGTEFVCMACHATAPDVAPRVNRHFLPTLTYNRMDGDGIAKQAKKAKADAKAAERKAVRLTKRDRKAMLADARAGDQPLAEVLAFIGGLEAVA